MMKSSRAIQLIALAIQKQREDIPIVVEIESQTGEFYWYPVRVIERDVPGEDNERGYPATVIGVDLSHRINPFVRCRTTS
ncbi:MAG: hypothetical protein F6K41_05225 [Symploca sp. SIO3E6]|nr:hypothetical protein [Caldora sp. SIO3E6]